MKTAYVALQAVKALIDSLILAASQSLKGFFTERNKGTEFIVHIYFRCCFLRGFSSQLYDIKNFNRIQIIYTHLYGSKYSYIILIII